MMPMMPPALRQRFAACDGLIAGGATRLESLSFQAAQGTSAVRLPKERQRRRA
jgi:hypothetical protein